MSLVLALLRRDFLISRTHRGALPLEGLGLIASAALIYYLGRSANGTGELFGFAAAGLVVLRLHTALPRTLEAVLSHLASGTFELVVSSRWSKLAIASATVAYESVRAAGMAVAMLIVATLVFGAPGPAGGAAVVAVALGLALGTAVFAGLTFLVLGMLLVMRQARTLASLSGIAIPVISGAYFPVGILHSPLDSIASALPFRRVSDLIRDGMTHGGVSAAPVLILGAEALALLCLGLLAFRAGTEHARRAGTLGTE